MNKPIVTLNESEFKTIEAIIRFRDRKNVHKKLKIPVTSVNYHITRILNKTGHTSIVNFLLEVILEDVIIIYPHEGGHAAYNPNSARKSQVSKSEDVEIVPSKGVINYQKRK